MTESRFKFGDLVRFRSGQVTYQVRTIASTGPDTFSADLVSTWSGRRVTASTNALRPAPKARP